MCFKTVIPLIVLNLFDIFQSPLPLFSISGYYFIFSYCIISATIPHLSGQCLIHAKTKQFLSGKWSPLSIQECCSIPVTVITSEAVMEADIVSSSNVLM